MIRIVFLTKRSVLFVLLASSAINPLLAIEPKIYSITKDKQQVSSIEMNIKKVLIDNGMHKDVANSKVKKMFKLSKYKSGSLSHLYNSPEVFVSKEKLNETLAKYALYEKALDFSSYSSLVGLAQSISLKPLEQIHLDKIKHIAQLNA